VNNIPKSKNKYDNTMLNHALIDNKLASAQLAIGESSNLAQLALSYSYNFDDKKYIDYVCILSVIAQVAIDNAKRSYDIDITEEIKRIKKDMDIQENKYPKFWSYIKKDVKRSKINNNLKCPMNYLCSIKFDKFRSEDSTLPMEYFFNKYELETNRRQSKKVEELIEKYSLGLLNSQIEDGDKDYLLLMSNFDDLIEDIKKVYISQTYIGLMSWLIDRAFLITCNIQSNKDIIGSNTNKNKALLLKTLFTINPKNVLKIFSKNA
jgi:hypothetical protein